jgi:S1-C subfamily serine protease
VLDDIVQYGSVRRGSIGAIRTVNLTPTLADELSLASTRGALVWSMARTSAAYEAGIRPGDVIVSFGGRAVEDAAQFVRLLSEAPIGSTVTIALLRGGNEVDARVRILAADVRR